MNPELVLAHFNRMSEAPDAISLLRQFVLELAVRGKLVDRDPNDEPTSALLNRIQAEKDRRVREGLIKKQECLPEVRPDETCFDIPVSWHWVRLGTITQVVMGQSPPGESYNKTGEGIPLINGPVEFTEGPFGKTFINQYTTAPTNLCEEGDLLLCVRGSTTGRTNIAGFRACIGRGVAAIRPFFADEYVRLFIWRQRASIIAMGRGIAFPSVSRHQIEELPVPLPPLLEQRRIVAKVDELMALCDQLDAAQAEREKRRDRLSAASLHRLNQTADTGKPQVFREHASFCLNHLPRLTTRPDHVPALRQTILNLAVRGQLVPQDLEDEPASQLLKRIQSKKGYLHATLSGISRDTMPFPLPPGWEWIRFGQIIADADAGWSPKCEAFPRSGDRWGVLKVSAVSWDRFLPDENKQLLPNDVPPERARVRRGDFLISRANTSELVAKCVIVKEEPMNLILSDKIVRLQIAEDCSKEFVCMVNNHAAHARSYYAEEASGTSLSMKNVSRAVIYALAVPLPPAAEQHRIVAKIGELMALCDRLEVQLTTAQTESRRLLEAVLLKALAPLAA